jgi:hypothetical protein
MSADHQAAWGAEGWVYFMGAYRPSVATCARAVARYLLRRGGFDKGADPEVQARDAAEVWCDAEARLDNAPPFGLGFEEWLEAVTDELAFLLTEWQAEEPPARDEPLYF